MYNRIKRIWALAHLVILDGIRRNALIGLILFALAGIVGGVFFFEFIPRDIGRATNDFLFSILWLTGLIFLLFHCVYTVAWDNDSGVLQSYLARPISRTEYTISVYLGLAGLLLLLNIILAGVSFAVLSFVKNSVDEIYFRSLSINLFLLSIAGMFFIQLMFLAVIMLVSSIIRGSFPVLLLSICYYFICAGLPVVRESKKILQISGDTLIPLTLKMLTFVFPDFSWLDYKKYVTSQSFAISPNEVGSAFLIASLYIIIMLCISCFIYERRDLQ